MTKRLLICPQCGFKYREASTVKGYQDSYCSCLCRAKAEPLHCKLEALMPESLRILAYDLYCLATHGDCPQWVRDSAEAIFQDLTK